MNPQARSSEASPSFVPATVTPPSTSSLCTTVPLHAAQLTESAAADRRVDDRKEAATRMEVDIVASTQEPPASITSGAAGHRRCDDTLQSRDLQHQSLASEEEPLDYREGEQLSPTGAGEGPSQEGQSATTMDEVVIPETEDLKVYFRRLWFALCFWDCMFRKHESDVICMNVLQVESHLESCDRQGGV